MTCSDQAQAEEAVARPTDRRGVVDALAGTDPVVVRGAGTKSDWGGPVLRPHRVVDLSALDRVIDHAAGDLVVQVEPGVRLAALGEVLASAGQRLAIDEVVPGSTIGGVLATGLSGPLRAAHGSVRDLVLGITAVLADGRSATTGGRVVKNVAGYDLAKLYTGSFGTLGVIVEAHLRLHPVPERQAWIAVADLADADDLAAAAVEVHAEGGGPTETVALVEGTAQGLAARIAARDEIPQPAWWGRLPGLGPGQTLIKLTTVRSGVPALVGLCRQFEGVAITGSAAVGVLYAGIAAGGPHDIPAVLGRLRAQCARDGGAAVVLRAPDALRAGIDAWGPIPAIDLMRRVKDQFDPGHRLAPGRFVGGI